MFADMENIPPISKELFQAIRLYVPKGGTILEFGSGPGSTEELRPLYELYSVEHNEWCKFNDEAHYFRAPLCGYDYPGIPVKWYDISVVKEAIKIPYQAILFDGPDTEQRIIPVILNHELFRDDVHWFFDDWNIQQIQDGILNLQRLNGRELIINEAGAKKFAVMLARNK